MKANELRIGNFINDLEDRSDPNIYVVARIESSEYTSWNSGEEYNVIASCLDPEKKGYFEIRPHGIPLTEEWLVKFGFTYNEDHLVYQKEGFNITDNTIIEGDYYLACYDAQFDDWDAMGHAFQYVHQLQNLYFALTGKELELIENKC
jgi:hypothetical protein